MLAGPRASTRKAHPLLSTETRFNLVTLCLCSWYVRLEGLQNNFWTAVGTTANPQTTFTYGAAGLSGYSSHKNIFYPDKDSEDGEHAWDNGDIISVTLDCDAHTLNISRNGEPLPTLQVQSGVKLYPWFNLYQGDSSIILLPDYKPRPKVT